MKIDLTANELDTLIESLGYSRTRIRDAQDTPYQVRNENLRRVEALTAKLRGPAQWSHPKAPQDTLSSRPNSLDADASS